MNHLAIMRQPFLDLVVSNKKTIESRWSNKKVAPYNKVQVGDTIFFKEVGKMVTSSATVKKVQFFELNSDVVNDIVQKYGKKICIDYFDNFDQVKKKKYCTLIWLDNVKAIEPFVAQKSHGAGWLILKDL